MLRITIVNAPTRYVAWCVSPVQERTAERNAIQQKGIPGTGARCSHCRKMHDHYNAPPPNLGLSEF
ncbi:MAG: hypothetical protein SWX82_08155 [Cyanobacteriota bacterium]|nr:hypothetical protein [Cyanobacteriota bacterium]